MSREAPSGLILASVKAGLLNIAANCDDRELGFPIGFLKSRVYAKLLTRLNLKRYQTFNGQVEEVEPDDV
jgi:hypothetical protein